MIGNLLKKLFLANMGMMPVFLPPQDISALGEPGSLLMQSLRRNASGIPAGIMSSLNALIRKREARDRADVESRTRALQGSMGGGSQGFFANLASRGQQDVSTGAREAINRNLLRDVEFKEGQEQFLGKLRLGGGQLQGQLGQARSAAERDLFAKQEGVRLQNNAQRQQKFMNIFNIGKTLAGALVGGVAGGMGSIPGLGGGPGGAMVGLGQGLAGGSLGAFRGGTSLFGGSPDAETLKALFGTGTTGMTNNTGGAGVSAGGGADLGARSPLAKGALFRTGIASGTAAPPTGLENLQLGGTVSPQQAFAGQFGQGGISRQINDALRVAMGNASQADIVQAIQELLLEQQRQ